MFSAQSDDYAACVAPVVERCKREIRRDIARGTVPATVRTFAELHDYVDANEYGGACETDEDGLGWWDGDEAQRAAAMTFWNRVQDAVDAWIRVGMPE